MTAREELLRLYRRDGFITPRTVLDAAQDEASPLHGHFTWNDDEAGEQWRLHEAATLIRRYKVEVEVGEDRTVRVRAFVNTGESKYKPAEDALRDPGDRDVVMGQAMRELRQLRRKYAALVDFDALVRGVMDEPEAGAA